MLEELQDSDIAIFEKVRLQLVEGAEVSPGESSEPAGGDDDDE